MSSVDIQTPAGKAAGKAELPAEIFDVQVNIPLMHQVVVAQLAAARQGTHDTKTRAEVSGGGRKPKKMKAAALRGALSDRARDGRIHVISELVTGDAPSTKAAVKAIEALNLEGGILVVLSRDESVSWLSLRNVPTVHVLSPDQLNTYDVLVCDHVLFTSAALENFLAGPATGKAVKATAKESEVQA